METILERGNMLAALKRVEGNKGAPGVDGMKTAQLRGYLLKHWEKIKGDLLDGTHLPMPVRRAEIPKDSGALVGDTVERTGEGTPQGGPLSPLLANIVLDELDKELERRGLRFVRYADDVAIYVRTPKAAERVKRSVSRFITGRLKLVVNEEKSAVGRPWQSKYLGFRITRLIGKTRTCIHPESVKRFRKKVRELTARDRGKSLGALGGSARTERYARRCPTTGSPARRGSSRWSHSVYSGRTANYAIRTVSGVGGALRKGRPYPDRLLLILFPSEALHLSLSVANETFFGQWAHRP